MHILFFTDNFPPEGNAIASRVYERACYWIRWGHQVTVITSVPNFPEGKIFKGYKNKFYQVEEMDGIRVVRVKTFIAKNKGFILRLLDFLSYIVPAFLAGCLQSKPDIIVATTPQFFVGLTAWGVSTIRKLPFILEVADIWPASIVGVGAMADSKLIRALEKLELFLYRQATAIVVLTAAFKENLTRRGIPASKMTTILNGVDLTKYMPLPKDENLAKELGLHQEHFVVGYIGTHGMAHDLMNVLKAAEILLAYPHILFLFVGAGAERDKLMAYAKKHNLSNVKFIPVQPKASIQRFWSVCQVALVHLKNDVVFKEVIPSKIFEAMGMGIPLLLVAPEGEASKIIVGNDVGKWVLADHPNLLADAVIDYYNDTHARLTHALNSLETAPLYSREKQARDLLDVIECYK